jgi:hypothetical protein
MSKQRKMLKLFDLMEKLRLLIDFDYERPMMQREKDFKKELLQAYNWSLRDYTKIMSAFTAEQIAEVQAIHVPPHMNIHHPKIIDDSHIIPLCRYCRFNGWYDYTISEHCINVARHLPAEIAIYGVLHDFHEIYSVDVVRPLKFLLMPYFDNLTHRLDCAFYNYYGLYEPNLRVQKQIKEIDDKVNRAEKRHFITKEEESENVLLFFQKTIEEREQKLKFHLQEGLKNVTKSFIKVGQVYSSTTTSR